MIDRITVLQDEMGSHSWLGGWKKHLAVTIRQHWQDVGPDELVVCSGDLTYEHVRRWLEQKQPALYIARGYLGNHLYKQRNWWRVTANGWANLRPLKAPFTRWGKMGLERHAWKVHEVKKVLVAPSRSTTCYWTGQAPDVWANEMASKFEGAEVKIRMKAGKSGIRWATLWDDLDWADMVVSQSSAITAEAFWYGKKAFSTEPCSTWMAGERVTFSNWQDPTEPPLRNEWHEQIAWSQYSNEEWATGGAIRMLAFCTDSLSTYDSGFKYQFVF